MNLKFNCPVCAADLQITTPETAGPCPQCLNNIAVDVQISAEQDISKAEASKRKVSGWKCSGVPHGSRNVTANVS